MVQRGARWVQVPNNHRPRIAGRTKYGFWRTVVVLLDLGTLEDLLDCSAHPMRLFGGLGLLSLGLAVLLQLVSLDLKRGARVDRLRPFGTADPPLGARGPQIQGHLIKS
jgi:hypothetical protein